MGQSRGSREETIILPKPAAEVGGFSVLRGRKRELLDEQRAAWEQGRPAEPQGLLERWPTDPARDPDAAHLLVEDFLQRRRRGEEPSLAEYSRRFPEHGGSLAGLVSLRSALESDPHVSAGQGRLLRLPDVGDEVFGFRLRHPLGQGAFARVFLAEQSDLAGRPVVLKISAIEGDEPQTLAQLQHTNIVPIYSVHEDARAGLRAVCMPYFGGASLSDVLRRAWDGRARPTDGQQLVAALEDVQAPAAGAVGGRGDSAAADAAPLERLRRMTYVQASAWVVAQLAEGLHHAHQRGILHRDVKPSNSLLSAEGEPLLLDFNLAHDQAATAAGATLGGTIAYMAPEHLRALLDGRVDRVDRRSDVYSLGMVLAEMLTGHCPFEQSGSYSVLPVEIEAMAVERSRAVPSLRQGNPEVPWGLESIARKCLDPDPMRRYQGADQLADDLRRFLDDRPLKHAPELSRVEQARKFVRRHPRLTAAAPVAAAAALLLAGAGLALEAVRAHLRTAEDRLGAAGARERLKAHDAGTARALCLVNTTLDLQDHLRDGIAECERTLALFDPPAGSPGPHPALARLAPADRRRVAEDRRELLLLLAGARVRLARGEPAALREALRLVDRAGAIPGLPPARAMWLDRARYLDRLGIAGAAADARRLADLVPASGPRDHYLLATAFAREGTEPGFRRALAELDRALEANPRHYWSLVQRGICRLELGDEVAAAGDFGACVGLWPEFAWGYFNRGCVLDRGGRKAEAVADYSAALARDPDFLPALLNRGLARLELKQHAAALADFDRALALGRDRPEVHAGRGIALEALGRHADADAAFAIALPEGASGDAADRLRWAYGFAVARRLPDRARRAFDRVLRHEPRHPQALYGRAMLAMDAGRDEEALGFFDRAIAADPGFNEARRYRAVLRARRGDWRAAGDEINRCLEREPRRGDTLYAAACVAALAARGKADAGLADQAVDLLRRAADAGADLARAAGDPDLAPLRDRPEFRALLAHGGQAGANQR